MCSEGVLKFSWIDGLKPDCLGYEGIILPRYVESPDWSFMCSFHGNPTDQRASEP